ncbi:MAG: serine/threonine protein kinase [Deltaproteobacteria bacterium]|nr:serine/threonine protein kinase [Deltaproteobacteria bacterium]
MSEEPATVLDRPSTRPRIETSTQQASARALETLEAQRLRGLMQGVCGSSAVTMLIVIVLGGDPTAARIHASALAGTAVASGIVAVLMRHPRRVWIRLAIYVLASQILVLLSGFYFWGVFSTYGALVPLTMYIIAGNATKTEAILGTAAVVLAQTAFSVATAVGWIGSRGLVEPVPARAPLLTQLVAVGLIQMITIGAMIAGRAARKESEKILDEHHKALVDLARREAQLAEAYADARAAREGNQAGLGRFSDQTVEGFRLGRVLGRGAMGEVYEGTRTSDAHPVAVKILAAHLLRDPSARERFLRESKIVSALESPHVVRVLAVPDDDAVLPFIAMERLEGTDLGQLIKRRSLLAPQEVHDIVAHVAAALDAAHAAGIIHRDLKPTNVFGTHEPRVWKLLDFGASRWADGQGTLTRDNVVGTPGYMAPEQASGGEIDRRADIYAFGALLYRLVTGVPAVIPAEVPVMLQEVTYRMPVQPRSRAPQVTADVEAVLAIALAKKREDRFATAGELARAYDAATRGALDPVLRSRAAMILTATPWGRWIDGRKG